MDKGKMYYIVEESALPDVVLKVVAAKALIDSGKHKTIRSAAAAVGISRSAFYKYKELVFPFYENTRGKTVTIAMNLDHIKGVLSLALNTIAGFDANVLTINQNIPINQTANVTITFETGENNVGEMVDTLQKIDGIQSLKIIARE